jgi:predicted RNA-binding protein with RPS1 domain
MAAVQGLRKGATVTCEVTAVQDNGIEVKIAGTDATAFIRRGDLARERAEQRPERFDVGEKVDAKITQIDKAGRKISVSIKALEIADEKAAVAQYGSTDSGASLGDILGAALTKAKKGDEDERTTRTKDDCRRRRGRGRRRRRKEIAARRKGARRPPARHPIGDRNMTLDADSIIAKRRLRRSLAFWRILAVLALVAAVFAVPAHRHHHGGRADNHAGRPCRPGQGHRA